MSQNLSFVVEKYVIDVIIEMTPGTIAKYSAFNMHFLILENYLYFH